MKMRKVKTVLYVTLCIALLVGSTSARAEDDCEYFTKDHNSIDNIGKYYAFYTDESDQDYVYDSVTYSKGGLNTLIFPKAYQGQQTKIIVRPRNGNCTEGASTIKKINAQNYSPFHDDPMCNDDDSGFSHYTIPTYEEVKKSPGGEMRISFDVAGGTQSYIAEYYYGMYLPDDLDTTIYIKRICIKRD